MAVVSQTASCNAEWNKNTDYGVCTYLQITVDITCFESCSGVLDKDCLSGGMDNV